MCTLQAIVGPIFSLIGTIAQPAIQPVQRYVFHYKQNLKNLEDEKNELAMKRENMQEKINEAEIRGDIIKGEASVWLGKADEMRQEVESFVERDTATENMWCFECFCPNFISRYRLGKRADQMIYNVKKCVQEGADIGEVSCPREAPQELLFPSSASYVSFASRDMVFKNILEALIGTNVGMIGIYGTGGVGKTTMVEAICKKIQSDHTTTFQEIAMAVVSQNPNVKKIQKQLAENLKPRLELDEKADERKRAGELYNRLKYGKAKKLIILDDIWQELDFKRIGIPVQDENKSCKILLTTRNREALMKMHVKDFEVPFLNPDEAWALFKTKAGDYVDTSGQELRQVAKEVCEECKGLPVAINAVAAALEDKELPAWKDARYQLRNNRVKNIVGIDREVIVSLEWSYNQLQLEDYKSCFLLCCLFPEDFQIPIDDLVSYSMAKNLLQQEMDTLENARYRVHTVVGTLKNRCLLLDGDREGYVKMHDVIRDIAISIAQDDRQFLVKHDVKEWPKKRAYEHCSAISLRYETIRELPDVLACSELHTLRLECTSSKFGLEIPDSFFNGIENLMVLDVNGVIKQLPSSLTKLSELRMLRLSSLLGDMVMLKCLKHNLELLILGGDGIKLPPEVGELAHLRLLDLRRCYELKVIPKGVISKLSRLEELYLPNFLNQRVASAINEEGSDIVSLEELKSLPRLTTLIHIHTHAKQLPMNLIRFCIVVGGEPNRGGIIGSLPEAGILKLNSIHLENILEHLLGKPKWSRERNCLHLSTTFRNLTHLFVQNCSRLKYLISPTCASLLLQLKRLEVKDCKIMEGVIGTDQGERDNLAIAFSQLKHIHLDSLPNLISFYPEKEAAAATNEGTSLFNDKVAFPALEGLEIWMVPNIAEIWDNKVLPAEYFSILRSLEVSGCQKLMNVIPINMLPQLQNLRDLTVANCRMLEVVIALEKRNEETQAAVLEEVTGCEIMEGVNGTDQRDKDEGNLAIAFSQLKHLGLVMLPKLISFYPEKEATSATNEGTSLFNDKVAFPALEELSITRVKNIAEIWDNKLLPAESFSLLRSLKVESCKKLMNVVPFNMLPQLQNLRDLSVRDCQMLEVVIALEKRNEETQAVVLEEVIVLPELIKLFLQELENFKSFCTPRFVDRPSCDTQVALPKLGELTLINCVNSTQIHPWPVQLACEQGLKSLKIGNCTTAVLLFFVQSSQKLDELHVKNCQWERENFQLEGLNVGEGQHVEPSTEVNSNEIHLWPGLACEQGLKCLEIMECDQVSTVVLPFLLQRVQNVDKLIVGNCQWEREGFDQLEGLNAGEGQHVKPSTEVRMMELDGVSQLTFLWNRDPHGLLVFQKLEYLVIKDCSNLGYLFTASGVAALQRLKVLYLASCSTMEEVIVRDEGNKEVTDDDHEIVFPKLEWLILKNLSDLKTFCGANLNLNLPSLQRVVLKRCPKMQTFSSGSIRMPEILLITRGNEGPQIEDLNKYLEQRLLKGEVDEIDDSNYCYVEEWRFSNIERIKDN